jgi:hypothetical protein
MTPFRVQYSCKVNNSVLILFYYLFRERIIFLSTCKVFYFFFNI